jgi:hypothetical protein
MDTNPSWSRVGGSKDAVACSWNGEIVKSQVEPARAIGRLSLELSQFPGDGHRPASDTNRTIFKKFSASGAFHSMASLREGQLQHIYSIRHTSRMCIFPLQPGTAER